MKIQYISDIHLEFMKDNLVNTFINSIKPCANILILAGDIGNPYQQRYKTLLEYVNNKFKKIFIIAGNHEYYSNRVENTKDTIKKICKNYENVSFLDNSYEEYDGYRFIGTTQWTEIRNPLYTINDINKINDLTIEKYNNLFYEAKEFLEKSVVPNSIIITHHLPMNDLTDPKYKVGFMAKYNQWFNANLDTFIEKHNEDIKAWFYGHTHSRSVQNHYGVNFYCNPLGYPGENSYEDINLVCDI